MISTSPQRPSWRTPLDLLFWLGRHELATLLMLAAVAGGVWAFLELASEVGEHDTHAVDERLLLLLRNPVDASDPLGPPWFEEVMRDFTALGGIGVQVVIVAATCVFLAIQRKRHAVVLLVASVGGALALSLLLKHGYDRPRPDLVPHGSIVMTSSFPSGHSMLSAATYLTLGALVARVLPGRRMKAFVILFAALLAGLAGVSRVYLGVHWPTDVVAGWTLGATWAVLCWLVARFLQRRGTVEDDDGAVSA
ncbi:MAG: phosphatase PAP2 family protein [Planctomycetota bacterium]